MVRPSTPWNEELQGLRGQYKRQDKNRFFRAGNLGYTNMRSPLSSTHRSFRLQFARRMGAQTDTLQWRHIYCSLYIYYEHRITRATLERARGRAMNEPLNWRLSLRFCFRVAKLYTKLKKQYSTANYSTPHTTKKQYHTSLNPTNTKINNSTTLPLCIFFLPP